ncbi:biopolymer transporter ExbD [uncultured Roseovarius sp.]|uniref:ExbD/TolR family protein n=1 Tax=uncultured Roseovarius sp. TaxID=293344 RepID=UPI00260A62C8|nr:biopolymer transporter ExbD [uncultured Roseovarius sp.]
MKRKQVKRTREPTIALINIVFLMLVFFMVAGTVAQPLDGTLNLVRTAELEGRAPPDALVVHSDGSLSYRGETVTTAASFLATRTDDERQSVRIVPDRDLPAVQLVMVARELRLEGAEKILVVTERGLQ